MSWDLGNCRKGLGHFPSNREYVISGSSLQESLEQIDAFKMTVIARPWKRCISSLFPHPNFSICTSSLRVLVLSLWFLSHQQGPLSCLTVYSHHFQPLFTRHYSHIIPVSLHKKTRVKSISRRQLLIIEIVLRVVYGSGIDTGFFAKEVHHDLTRRKLRLYFLLLAWRTAFHPCQKALAFERRAQNVDIQLRFVLLGIR